MASPVEEIKSRLNIVDLVQSYVKLEKAGTNYKARCPFHNEKTPSFFVSPARQMWHCFGCSAGGDHFEFVQKIENVEFPEAMRILADKTGVELRREDPQIRSERARLLNLLDDAARFYEANLVRRKDVGAYLKDRGLTGETAKSFRLGYAESGWDNVLTYLKARGYSEYEIDRVGLAIKKEGGGYYDRFRSRIMFPLFDSSGRAVGFSGRIFMPDAGEQKDADAKYINSPGTIFYDKSKLLYGFDRAKLEIRRLNTAILVEGQMDLVMSHQAGVTNTIAVSGTALTGDHLAMLKRLADRLILSFDMDRAGILASEKAIGLGLACGFDVRALVLPSGKDPADLIKENPESWKSASGTSRPVIEYLLDVVEKNSEDARSFRRGAEQRIIPHIAAIHSDLDRAHWVEALSRRLKLPSDPIWDAVKKFRANRKLPSAPSEDSGRDFPKTRKDLIEERILGLAVSNSGLIAEADCKPEWFSSGRREIFRQVLSGNIPEDHYLKKLALAAEILTGDSDSTGRELQSLVKELRREDIKDRLQVLSVQIRESEQDGNQEESAKKLEEFKRLSDELNIGRS